jgi:DNA repair photolyase
MNMDYKIRKIIAKSILSKSGLPDTNWVINPYTGCRFGCAYCYAYFVGKFTHKDENWGNYVDVKINAPEILDLELSKKLTITKNIGSIFISSVTDPYQPVEAQYKITKKCLEILLKHNYEGEVGILTKSSLVLRDIDLFKNFKNIVVGLTITSTGDPISKFLEINAPPNQERLIALTKLRENGVKTYAFIGPLLPHFVFDEENLENLLVKVKTTGVSYLYIEHINLSGYIKERLFSHLTQKHPELIKKFQESDNQIYRDKLNQMIYLITRKLNLPIKNNTTIHHPEKGGWKK